MAYTEPRKARQVRDWVVLNGYSCRILDESVKTFDKRAISGGRRAKRAASDVDVSLPPPRAAKLTQIRRVYHRQCPAETVTDTPHSGHFFALFAILDKLGNLAENDGTHRAVLG